MITDKDRELLELAAKAADIDGVHDADLGVIVMKDCDYTPSTWNPLTRDGDALRLAVKLGITVENPHQYNTACATVRTKCSYCGGDYRESWAEITPDAYSGTRRAIVLAAAEIGRSMP